MDGLTVAVVVVAVDAPATDAVDVVADASAQTVCTMQLEISLTSSLKGHLTPEVMTAYSDLNEFKVALVLIVAVTIVSKVHEVSTT